MIRHWAHGGDALEVIGLVTEAREDEFGLWSHAELSSAQMAQDARTKVLEGLVNAKSIGYSVTEKGWKEIEWEDGDAAVELTDLIWHESTLTLMPANPLAVITAAKAKLDQGVPEGHALSDAERGDLQGLLDELTQLGKSLETILRGPAPQAPQIDVAALHARIEAKRRWLRLQMAAE
jgi:HK97 family phage prohead protease